MLSSLNSLTLSLQDIEGIILKFQAKVSENDISLHIQGVPKKTQF